MQEQASGASDYGTDILSYYKTVVELGTAELVQYRSRVYQNIKINLAVATAIALLMFFTEGMHYSAFFTSVLILFGIMSCYMWIRQIGETLTNIANWRLDAARIEETAEFHNAIGGVEVKVWTRPDLMANIEKGTQVEEPSGKHHKWIPTFWLLFYVVVGILLYLKMLGAYLEGAA